jgi:uncharacterized membrane protein YdjX (TVP38/TMEM64 family)
MKYRRIVAILPFALILALILIFYLSGLYHKLNFNMIKDEHLKWKVFVDNHPFLSAFYFMGIYIISVVLVIPDSAILTLIGGFLFPLPLAVAYACIAETMGAVLFFLAARIAFAETIGKRKGYLMHGMETKFQANQVYYLLFFRLSHLLPFWVINLVAGVFRGRSGTFLWTTFVGVIPLTVVLAYSGASLSKYFETHTQFSLKDVFTPEIKIGLIALGCIALLPLAYKKFIEKKKY